MKTSIQKIFLALSPLVFCGGCNFMQVSSSTVGFAHPNRTSVVEKAWMARHEYDAKTGLLQPYYRGMRYGAIRSYDRQEKTLSSKEWWLKDRKMNDLSDKPLQFATRRPRVPVTLPAAGAATPSSLPVIPPVQPTSVAGAEPPVAIPGIPEMPVFSTGEAIPDLPGGIPADALGIDSPFLPGGLPTPADPTTPTALIPGMALPGIPLLPGGGPDMGNAPFGADPAAGGGAFPADPALGGGMPAPPAPAPVDGNPFGAPPPPGANPNPAPPPVDENPFGAPPPPGANPNPAPPPVDENPFPAPPAPGGANPVPAVPAPMDENPFPAPPAPVGDAPAKPAPLPF
jgi:hypothetical protein